MAFLLFHGKDELSIGDKIRLKRAATREGAPDFQGRDDELNHLMEREGLTDAQKEKLSKSVEEYFDAELKKSADKNTHKHPVAPATPEAVHKSQDAVITDALKNHEGVIFDRNAPEFIKGKMPLMKANGVEVLAVPLPDDFQRGMTAFKNISDIPTRLKSFDEALAKTNPPPRVKEMLGVAREALANDLKVVCVGPTSDHQTIIDNLITQGKNGEAVAESNYEYANSITTKAPYYEHETGKAAVIMDRALIDKRSGGKVGEITNYPSIGFTAASDGNHVNTAVANKNGVDYTFYVDGKSHPEVKPEHTIRHDPVDAKDINTSHKHAQKTQEVLSPK